MSPNAVSKKLKTWARLQIRRPRAQEDLRWPRLVAGLGPCLTLCLLLSASASASHPGALKAGQEAPRFRLRTLEGRLVRLDRIAYQGRPKSYAHKRPVLIDFFRTDCRPCILSMPKLQNFYEKHKDSGLEVIVIALLEEDDGVKRLTDYLEKAKLPFTVVVDRTEYVTKKFLGAKTVLPACFLIDRNGIVRGTKFGSRQSYEDAFRDPLPDVLAGKSMRSTLAPQ